MRNAIGLVLLTTLLAGLRTQVSARLQSAGRQLHRGRTAFVELHCNSCHEIEGLDLEYLGGPAHVTLGGKTPRIQAEGELVTSIINPSHKLAPRYPEDQVAVAGQSIMSAAYLNDVMTVQQLIDLVAFLQSTYQIAPPPVPAYWRVYP